jgi:hypothetical protein
VGNGTHVMAAFGIEWPVFKGRQLELTRPDKLRAGFRQSCERKTNLSPGPLPGKISVFVDESDGCSDAALEQRLEETRYQRDRLRHRDK